MSKSLTDTNQNFWQMASIQTAASGISATTAGRMLANTYSFGTSLTSILVGSLILWLVGLAIITMAMEHRAHAIQNVREHLGIAGALGGAALLLIAFVFWIALQLESGMAALKIPFANVAPGIADLDLRFGAACGVGIALLATGGIRVIKWICVISLPFILVALVVVLLAVGVAPSLDGPWLPSLTATLTIVAFTLSGTVNLPTFFRHSRSKQDSFLALSILIVLSALINMVSFWLPSDAVLVISKDTLWGHWPLLLLFGPVNVISLVCVNLVNIYFASAGWETLIKMKWKAKEYAIVGLAGTVVYVFVQIQAWTFFVVNVITGFLGCMGIALVAAFLIRLVVRHRPRRFERLLGLIAWGIGCVVVLIKGYELPSDPGPPLLEGVLATALVMIIFVLIEETYWSVRQLVKGVGGDKRIGT